MSELTMNKSQREAFLADLHVGVVTAARDGAAPLAAPVWYSYEPGGDVVFVFESASEKVKLVEATGQASLCVQSEAMPYKYVTLKALQSSATPTTRWNAPLLTATSGLRSVTCTSKRSQARSVGLCVSSRPAGARWTTPRL